RRNRGPAPAVPKIVSNGAPERRQPALQFILERLDPVLHLLGAVPHLAEVAVHATYHGFAAVTQLFRDGEQADRRSLDESLQPSRAVGVPEHLGSDLPSLPPGPRRDGIVQPPEVRQYPLLTWPVTSSVVTNVTVTLLWLFFFVFNRTLVIGRRNVGEEPNTLLLSTHQSLLDSFLVGLAAFYPRSWLKPRLIPWNPAAAENFYKNPILAWLADNWKCIWVRPGRRDLHALHRMMHVLPQGTMTLFPEGTRSRDGAVGPGRPGPGLLVLAARPRVIPVAIEGMQDVLPIGRYVPRVFK